MGKMFRRLIGAVVSVLLILVMVDFIGATNLVIVGAGLFMCAALITTK